MLRHRSGLLTSLILIGSFFFSSNFSSAKVLISKIQIAGVSTTDEFVELYNYSSSSISLFDWDLRKQTAGGTQSYLISSFPSSTILNPFSYFLVAHRDYVTSGDAAADLNYSNNSISLAANNSAALYDESDQLIDRVDWGTVSSTVGASAPNPVADQKLVRLPNDASGNYQDSDDSSQDFVLSADAPFNSLSPARPAHDDSSTETSTAPTIDTSTLWRLIKVNEVMPNPSNGDEWIELYNTGTSSLDLTGGSLCDSRTDSCTIATLKDSIAANGFLAIYLSGSHLNNDGDSVILKNPSGEVIDQISYGAGSLRPDKGQSLARITDGADTDNGDDWAVTEVPTPGAANLISIPPVTAPSAPVSAGGSSNSTDYFASILQTNNVKPAAKKTVKIQLPTISWDIDYPTVVRQNSSTLFDAHRSADPRGGELLITWSFGNGTCAEGSRIAQTFASSGIYQVTVMATSTEGTTGQKTFSIKVGAADSPIFINEILARPEIGEDESIAIASSATDTVDVGNYRLGTDNDKWFTIPAGTLLRPDGILRFFKGATHLTLNDSGGSVLLENSKGDVMDVMDYGKTKRGEIITTSSTESAEPAPVTSSGKVYKYFPIDAALELPTDSGAFIEGDVLSLPGEPYANYFYLTDGGASIQIYSAHKNFPALQLGERVSVFGKIGSANGAHRLKIKNATDIRLLTGMKVLNAEAKAIADVDEGDYGSLVTLHGEITKQKGNYFYLDDGSAETEVNDKTLDKKQLQTGSTVTVTGIVEKNSDAWRLTPRSNEDLKIEESISSSPTSTASSTAKIAVSTGGGLALLGLAWAAKRWVMK